MVNGIDSGFQKLLHVSTAMLYLKSMWEIPTSVRKYSTIKIMCWRNSIFTLRIKGQDHYLSSCTDLSSKYLKDLNKIPAILKFVKDKEQTVHHLSSIGSQTINKWSPMKLKCILTVNNTLIQVKRQPVEHKNIFFQPYICYGIRD